MTTTVSEQLKILIELQKIDGVIHELRKELSEHPVTQKKIESEFEKKKAGCKSAEDEMKVLLLKQKEKEGDLMSREEKIKKLQSQLYSLKSNKEYSAMDFEIKGLKADKSLLEEDILKILDTMDEAKGKLSKEKELLVVEEKKMKEAVDLIKKRSQAINAEVEELETKRKAYSPNVEVKLINQYEKLLKNRDGLAIVPLKNMSCGGCHMELPPQAVHEVRLQEKIIVCESCARILYSLT